jgi:nucleosome binding factor SPN SPT16 subunit
VKEDPEVINCKKAAFLASKVMQAWVVEKIEDIIDKNKKVKHSKLSGE